MVSREDPLELFHADRQRARELQDLSAALCTVASVDASGQPQARTLVLRDVGGALALFYNTTSPKHAELSEQCAIVCYFATIKCQWRLHCETEPMPAESVHESWQLRPDMPKRLDWYYTHTLAQSGSVASRETLLEELLAAELPNKAPHTATGMWLKPTQFERLDLGQADGLHERIRWRAASVSWLRETLVP